MRAPGVELDHAELRQRQIALGVLDRDDRSGPRRREFSVSKLAIVAGMPVKAWRWKKQSSGLPVGQRTSDTGRPKRCGSMKSPTAA